MNQDLWFGVVDQIKISILLIHMCPLDTSEGDLLMNYYDSYISNVFYRLVRLPTAVQT